MSSISQSIYDVKNKKLHRFARFTPVDHVQVAQGGHRYATNVATNGVITCSTISAEKWARLTTEVHVLV
jgi:hypothetical protein